MTPIVKKYPELLMTFVFVVCICYLAWLNHVHNDSESIWAQNLASQAFASVTTLVVKGALGPDGPAS